MHTRWKSFLSPLISAHGARRHGLDRPIIIDDCGRSGTTILGNLLGKHPQVAYLNEPRDIWSLDPRTDIWTEQARRRGGKLVLTAHDVSPRTQRVLRRSFARRVHRDGKERLVEKLPANSFRIGYVARILPNARFIHVVRNGMDVAKSIALEAQQYDWYGHGDYKWQLLAAYGIPRVWLRLPGSRKKIHCCAACSNGD